MIVSLTPKYVRQEWRWRPLTIWKNTAADIVPYSVTCKEYDYRSRVVKLNGGFFTVGENIQHDAEFSMTMNFSLLKSALKVKDL